MTKKIQELAEAYATTRFERFTGKIESYAWKQKRDDWLSGYKQCEADKAKGLTQVELIELAKSTYPESKDNLQNNYSDSAIRNIRIHEFIYGYQQAIGIKDQTISELKRALEEAYQHFDSIRSGLTTDINKVESMTKSLARDACIEVFKTLQALKDKGIANV